MVRSPPGDDKEQFRLRRFARDQRWKLYDDDSLCDIPRDELEQQPVRRGEGDMEATRARQKLEPVIQRMMRQERTSRN